MLNVFPIPKFDDFYLEYKFESNSINRRFSVVLLIIVPFVSNERIRFQISSPKAFIVRLLSFHLCVDFPFVVYQNYSMKFFKSENAIEVKNRMRDDTLSKKPNPPMIMSLDYIS